MVQHDEQVRDVVEPGEPSQPLAESDRKDHALTIGLVIFFAVETLILVAILLAVAVPLWIVVAIVVLKWLVPIIVLPVIVRLLWTPIARHFPAQPIGEFAVSRTFQSFAFGYINRWNHCLTITVDEDCMHIQPLELLRWFGARPLSIPLDDISIVKSGTNGDPLRATAGPFRLVGPRWCLELAGHAEMTGTDDEVRHAN